jgi:biopolymer transport protein ExbD
MRRRGWQRHQHHGQVDLNVIPLIDVVFFLLVFYVISTSFVQESSVAIDRPTSSQAAMEKQAFVPVTVVKSGAVYVGQNAVALGELAAAVGIALGQASTSRVVVVADRDVTTGMLLSVMDACQRGGAAVVDVAANRTGD